MLDLKFIIENIDVIKEGARKKGFDIDFDRILQLADERKKLIKEVEQLKAEKNKVSKLIPSLNGIEKKAQIERMKIIKQEESKLSDRLKRIEEALLHLRLKVPNPPLDEVPVGEDDSDNVEIERWGQIPEFDFTIKSHIELGNNLDMIDFKRASKISGTRQYFLKGYGVLLHLAILRYAIDFIIKKGFLPFIPPLLVRYEAMQGTGYFPFGIEEAYHIERDSLYLIGTSEVSVVSYHSEEILKEEDLPLLYAGYSTCFRREAGSYGKDTKGLFRVHQFDKVEQVVICKNNKEESMKYHYFLLENAKEFLKSLNLPFRVVKVCTGDMGAGQVLKHDIEVWMPSRNNFSETHSCSSFFDYQSRRLGIRVKSKNGKIFYPYTLNNTLIASPRILIPIMEIYQQSDGSIKIPEVLVPYMNGMEIIKK